MLTRTSHILGMTAFLRFVSFGVACQFASSFASFGASRRSSLYIASTALSSFPQHELAAATKKRSTLMTPPPQPQPQQQPQPEQVSGQPQVKRTFYKRTLPDTCIGLSSKEGKKIFASALATNGLKSFFPLIEQL